MSSNKNDVEFDYMNIRNYSCIFPKMAVKMAARKKFESNVSQLCYQIQRQTKCLAIRSGESRVRLCRNQ